MNIVDYVTYSENDKSELSQMIKSLYNEDPEGGLMTDEKIGNSISNLNHHKDFGRIVMLKQSGTVIGYSILINYLSNEYGGIILYIDELYIKPGFRGQRIGSDFINYLIEHKYNDCKAIFLEVLPSNENAYRLYTNLGFQPFKNKILRYLI